MLCEFVKLGNKEWICTTCGRRSKIQESDRFSPTAKCRVLESAKHNSNYIFEKKLKGVGDCLSIIIKKLGHTYEPMGAARARLTFLNKRSIKWCSDHKEIIYFWLKEECRLRNVTLIPSVGKAIIRLAIMKAYSG